MTVNKRKKVTKYRAHSTHGCGSKKKARGAGNRGGRGMAGTGKRAHQKKPGIYKIYGPAYFGKRGFKIPPAIKKHVQAINIRDLPDTDEINLTALGYTKLLAAGTPKRKHTIIVATASHDAKEKIKNAGGQLILQQP